jgi:hypothetical protein
MDIVRTRRHFLRQASAELKARHGQPSYLRGGRRDPSPAWVDLIDGRSRKTETKSSRGGWPRRRRRRMERASIVLTTGEPGSTELPIPGVEGGPFRPIRDAEFRPPGLNHRGCS